MNKFTYFLFRVLGFKTEDEKDEIDSEVFKEYIFTSYGKKETSELIEDFMQRIYRDYPFAVPEPLYHYAVRPDAINISKETYDYLKAELLFMMAGYAIGKVNEEKNIIQIREFFRGFVIGIAFFFLMLAILGKI